MLFLSRNRCPFDKGVVLAFQHIGNPTTTLYSKERRLGAKQFPSPKNTTVASLTFAHNTAHYLDQWVAYNVRMLLVPHSTLESNNTVCSVME
jgi:hypothetical protein